MSPKTIGDFISDEALLALVRSDPKDVVESLSNEDIHHALQELQRLRVMERQMQERKVRLHVQLWFRKVGNTLVFNHADIGTDHTQYTAMVAGDLHITSYFYVDAPTADEARVEIDRLIDLIPAFHWLKPWLEDSLEAHSARYHMKKEQKSYQEHVRTLSEKQKPEFVKREDFQG